MTFNSESSILQNSYLATAESADPRTLSNSNQHFTEKEYKYNVSRTDGKCKGTMFKVTNTSNFNKSGASVLHFKNIFFRIWICICLYRKLRKPLKIFRISQIAINNTALDYIENTADDVYNTLLFYNSSAQSEQKTWGFISICFHLVFRHGIRVWTVWGLWHHQ